MPSRTHTTDLDIPIEKVCDFVSNMNRWVPLVPGYIEHEILNKGTRHPRNLVLSGTWYLF